MISLDPGLDFRSCRTDSSTWLLLLLLTCPSNDFLTPLMTSTAAASGFSGFTWDTPLIADELVVGSFCAFGFVIQSQAIFWAREGDYLKGWVDEFLGKCFC